MRLTRGELKLASTDPNAQPLLDYRLLEHPEDLRRHREAARLAVKLTEHRDFQPIIDKIEAPTEAELASDDALDDWLMRDVSAGGHVSGTCKMGPRSDPMAVVDQFGRVHGIRGLRVADASIMPDCVRANTNATCMMIGERVAEFIRNDP